MRDVWEFIQAFFAAVAVVGFVVFLLLWRSAVADGKKAHIKGYMECKKDYE